MLVGKMRYVFYCQMKFFEFGEPQKISRNPNGVRDLQFAHHCYITQTKRDLTCQIKERKRYIRKP